MKNGADVKYYKNLNRGKWTERKIDEIFQELPNKTVSDIGAGFGWMKPIIQNRGLEWQPFDMVRKMPETRIWDLNDPAPEGIKSAGLVICLEVIEHLANPELALRNITAHISLGGYLIISSPNPFYKKSKFDFFFKNQLYAFQPKHLSEHHVYIPLPHVLNFYLEKEGFKLVEFSIMGESKLPEVGFSDRFLKSGFRFLTEELLGKIGNKQTLGPTQGFVFKKLE
ncbi:class I SAM-dependent methyltransferase [Salegentibacter chungangensis]|uniref:Class I SAM-dependent methyltransferase n=1 Tax=Salegentibacter chungangensis TaxID=1335724 RepID=A0ABW3NR92_9FLAO